jgi:hypothetical protein
MKVGGKPVGGLLQSGIRVGLDPIVGFKKWIVK